MVELFGMMVEEKEYKKMVETVKIMWEEEKEDDYWEDFEEFEEHALHRMVYEEV